MLVDRNGFGIQWFSSHSNIFYYFRLCRWNYCTTGYKKSHNQWSGIIGVKETEQSMEKAWKYSLVIMLTGLNSFYEHFPLLYDLHWHQIFAKWWMYFKLLFNIAPCILACVFKSIPSSNLSHSFYHYSQVKFIYKIWMIATLLVSFLFQLILYNDVWHLNLYWYSETYPLLTFFHTSIAFQNWYFFSTWEICWIQHTTRWNLQFHQ